jgi:ABC-type cobalamin/Fe3+-siderophores transport system ATPase subunit
VSCDAFDTDTISVRSIGPILHYVNQAARYSDQGIAMRNGRTFLQTSPCEGVAEDIVPESLRVGFPVIEDPRPGPRFVPKAALQASAPHTQSRRRTLIRLSP